jgi:hypothetical protein
MRTMKLVAIAVGVLIVMLGVAVSVASADQFSGTWKLNAAKSKYATGQAPQALTLKVESDADSYKLTGDGTDSAGKPLHAEYSAKFDGKDYPAKTPYGDTVSLKRIDANTIESTNKKDGKVTVTVTTVISKDGKTRTSTFKGKDAEGHEINNVAVYDKQ